MKNLLYLTILFFWIPFAEGQFVDKRDYIFLIDASASMAGKEQGSVNIIPKVRVALEEYAKTIPIGSRVVVMPFSDVIMDRFDITIKTTQDITQLQEYFMSIDPTGRRTFIYRSLGETEKIAKEMNGINSPRQQHILLYTDGRDNDPARRSMDNQMELFSRMRRDNNKLFLFYYTLGVDLPEEEKQTFQVLQTAGSGSRFWGNKIQSDPQSHTHPCPIIPH